MDREGGCKDISRYSKVIISLDRFNIFQKLLSTSNVYLIIYLQLFFSPNFPAKQWGRVRQYWRSHLDIEFPVVSKIATKEVIRIRSGRK